MLTLLSECVMTQVLYMFRDARVVTQCFCNSVTGVVSQEYEWNPTKCHTARSCLGSSESADTRALQSTISYKSDYDVIMTSSLLPNG